MAIIDAEAVVEDVVVENNELEREQYWDDVMIRMRILISYFPNMLKKYPH